MLAAAFAAAQSVFAAATPLGTYAEAEALTDAEFAECRPFEFRCQVIGVYPNGGVFARDSSGYFTLLFTSAHDLRPGQIAIANGHTKYKTDSSRVRDLICDHCRTIGDAPLPEPELTTVSDLVKNSDSIRFVRLRGMIEDAFADEIDSEWNFFILRDGADVLHVSIFDSGDMRKRIAGFMDAEVEVTGALYPGHGGFRIFIGPFVRLWSESCIRFIKTAPEDPFMLPQIGDVYDASPDRIASMGRRTACGDVIAAWSGGHLLIRRQDGSVMGVELADDSDIPAWGDRIRVVGHPETDLYRINLSNSLFRREQVGTAPFGQDAESVTPEKIMLDDSGRQMIKPNYHGRLVKLSGIVRALPSDAADTQIIHIESGRFLVSIDVSANPDAAKGLEIGCRIEATGVCVLESPNWSRNVAFPRIGRMFLVPRGPQDLRVLSRPPWWTSGRLFALIGILLAILAVILAWNMMLRHMIKRAVLARIRAETSKIAAVLRIDERTRLAAELHDSLVQSLTGISMQIAAAKSARVSKPEAEPQHLDAAEQMLRSSMTGLRRCIMDLRSEALDEPDFAKAIASSVKPVLCAETLVHVKCNIPRERLSDTTAHDLLQVVRELSSNATVHGKAHNIWISGKTANGVLELSVKDDGSGFDPHSCPGPDMGHFGLRGIRERVKRLGGDFSIESNPVAGTLAIVKIMFHHSKKHEG